MEFERGQETCNCDTANLFMCDMPQEMQDALALRGMVSGQPTEILQTGDVYRFPNTLDGTLNTLELAGNGMAQCTYFDDLSSGAPLVPEDMQMYIGARDASTAAPGGATGALAFEQAGGDTEGVFLLALTRTPIGEGEIDPDTMSPEDLIALSDELGAQFGVFWTDLHSVYNSLGGAVARSMVSQAYRFETTFRNVNELLGRQLSLADQIRMRGIFLREIFSARPARVVMHRGQKLISFRGPAGNRAFLSRTAFPANTMAVLDANIVANDNARAVRNALGRPFRGANGVFLIIGGVIEVVHWLTLPESERFLSDLLVNLGIMVGIGVLSGIAATAAVLGGIAATGVALPVVVTGLAIGAVAVGIGLVMGFALEATGLKDLMQSAARRFFGAVAGLARQVFPPRQQMFFDHDVHPIQRMGLAEGIDYINNAPHEEVNEMLDYFLGGN